jgi:TPR repeat protein
VDTHQEGLVRQSKLAIVCAVLFSMAALDPARSQQPDTSGKPSAQAPQAAGNTQTAPACPQDRSSAFADADVPYAAKDYPTAFGKFLVLAKCGDPLAQHRIGDMYYAAQSVPQNLGEARAWYLKAAKQGHVETQFNLGVIYFQGLGTPKNFPEARNWYLKAAEQGHAKAQNALGAMFHDGLGGKRDTVEALRWFLKAAEQGHAQAQNNVGISYAAGRGIPKDYAEARKWYLKAAEQGLAQAQYHLGGLYQMGNGVPRDIVQAMDWYLKAAAQGDAEAQYRLGTIFEKGENVANDYAQAVNWWFKAAEQGYAPAQYRMAEAHLNLAMFGARKSNDFVLTHMWATVTERRACAEMAKYGEGVPGPRDTHIACLGAPHYRNAVAITMTADEIRQAEVLAGKWKAGANADSPPSPEALRTLSKRMPPFPLPADPDAPPGALIQKDGKSYPVWGAVPSRR